MKTLILIRHAKSSWKHDGLEDWERPLNSRGLRNAPALAERFAHQPFKPSLMISSHATRALATARIFARALDYPLERLQLSERVYESPAEQLQQVISEVADEHTTIALFGHNPGLTDLINRLSGADLENLPTSGIAVLELDIEHWRELSASDDSEPCAHLISLSYPKQPDEPTDTAE